MLKKLSAILTILTLLVIPAAASAHVTVKPAEVGVGSYQTFTTNVPNEKDMATVGVRLVIPSGLQYVQPNVKNGWTIDEKTTGGGEFPTVTEISWTGGSIPSGQRDEFAFAAQVPAKATSLHWKAYQTYADGTTVAWDQTPSGKDDESETPYSETKVVNDLAATSSKSTSASGSNSTATLALIVGLVALVVSLGSIILRQKR